MSFKKIKIGEFLKRSKNLVEIKNDESYKLVTVRLYHKGVTLRKEVLGSELSSNKMHGVSEGEFILSGIDARHGAFGIIPAELDGAVVSNDFWCFNLDENVIDKHFFLKLTSTSFFDDICKKASDGTTNRVRLQADKFFNVELSLPALEEQKKLAERFKKLETEGNLLKTETDRQLDLVKKLRQQFLKEAMQGKLLPQVSTDAPAAELLKSIHAEKQRLIAEKALKKDKPLQPISPEEIPFDIPDHWVWCRLGEIAYVTSGSTPSHDAFVKEGIPFLKMYNLKNQKIDFEFKPQFIKEEVHNGQLKRCRAYPGDLLMNIVGPPLGKLAIIPDSLPECNFNQAAVLIRCFLKEIFKEVNIWVFWYLNELSEINSIDTKGVAGQNNISVTQAQNMRIPLPPLAEQARIVEKLEKLMRWCDELEAGIREGRTHAEKLLQAALREALRPPAPVVKSVEPQQVEMF